MRLIKVALVFCFLWNLTSVKEVRVRTWSQELLLGPKASWSEESLGSRIGLILDKSTLSKSMHMGCYHVPIWEYWGPLSKGIKGDICDSHLQQRTKKSSSLSTSLPSPVMCEYQGELSLGTEQHYWPIPLAGINGLQALDDTKPLQEVFALIAKWQLTLQSFQKNPTNSLTSCWLLILLGLSFPIKGIPDPAKILCQAWDLTPILKQIKKWGILGWLIHPVVTPLALPPPTPNIANLIMILLNSMKKSYSRL